MQLTVFQEIEIDARTNRIHGTTSLHRPSKISQAPQLAISKFPKKNKKLLRPDGVAIDEATSSPSLSSSSLPSSTTPMLKIPKTKNAKKRPVYHEALVKLQKVWGVKPDDWDYEDEINDNDIITIFRERMDDENDLAFSDDKWSEESQENAKDIPFDPRICEDNHSFCSIWTAYRLCHPHARFMYKYCRKSCGICL